MKITKIEQFNKLPKKDRDEIINDRLIEAIDIFCTHYKNGKPYCDNGNEVYEIDNHYAMTLLRNDLIDGIHKIKVKNSELNMICELWVNDRQLDDYREDMVNE